MVMQRELSSHSSRSASLPRGALALRESGVVRERATGILSTLLRTLRLRGVAIVLMLLAGLSGCATQSSRARPDAVYALQAGRFDVARAELRPHAADRASPDVILDNLRLAVASLNAGAFAEAEWALQQARPLMVSGTVNARDRNAATTFRNERALVWRGEPFEQAMSWYYQAVLQFLKGDFENARAAARNMQFTLVDFAGYDTVEAAVKAAESPEWFNENADEVENDLVLGYLLAGIAEIGQDRSADADEFLDRALELRPDLEGLIAQLRAPDTWNTLLIVESGEGPTKVLRGEYQETFTYEPTSIPTPPPPLAVYDASLTPFNLPDRATVTDTWRLAQYPRWWSLRSLRERKKALGEFLSFAGTGAAIYGSVSNDANTSDKALLAGVAAILAGKALASSSAADARYLDVLPRAVYLVPLNLAAEANALVLRAGDRETVRHQIRPGRDEPAVYYIRINERGGPWEREGITTREAVARPVAHPNDVTGPVAGTFPYILGGTCVCTPSPEVLATYHAGGYLLDFNLEDLLDLYRAEGIVFDPLPYSLETAATWSHLLRGGRLLQAPIPGSAGFEELTYFSAPVYRPRSELVRQVAASVAVQ